VLGSERDKVTGEWRKLPVEELHELSSSLNAITVIKSYRIRGVGHVACMGGKEFW
jgi:hypothetical protein